ALARELWPHLEAALEWITRWGDRDGDGFVEYRSDPEGLRNQGWKDSHDAISHADGSLAEGPIALCEVQAYVFAALRGMGWLARLLSHGVVAERVTQQAAQLADRFEQSFWCDRLGTYGLALDGDKHLCRVCGSNAGHVLLAGLASTEHAAGVIAKL